MTHVEGPDPCSCLVLLFPLEGKAEELRQLLDGLAVRIRMASGCREVRLTHSGPEGHPCELWIAWKDGASLDAFWRSEFPQVLAGAVTLLGVTDRFRFIVESSVPSTGITEVSRVWDLESLKGEITLRAGIERGLEGIQ